MQVSHTPKALSVSFDDPNLVSTAGLVPILRLADQAGLHTLAQERLTIPGDKGANAGAKITTLIGEYSRLREPVMVCLRTTCH